MFNALAAGRKVYGQGSYAPNRGQVSAQGAQGYLKREVRNNAGNRNLFGGVSNVGPDGQSDTRSGVAARALNRKMGQNTGRPVIQQRQTPSGGGGKATQPQQPQAPAGPPPVKINSDGTLELPFNMQVSQDIMQAEQDMNAQLIGLKGEQEQQNLQYNQNMRQTDIDYRDLQRGTLNNAAGRGSIFSSGYGQSVLDNSNAYTNQQGDLTSQNSLYNRTVDQQRLGIQSAFQNMMSQFALDQANAAAENAGGLGYGDSKVMDKGGHNHVTKKHIKRNQPKKKGGKK